MNQINALPLRLVSKVQFSIVGFLALRQFSVILKNALKLKVPQLKIELSRLISGVRAFI